MASNTGNGSGTDVERINELYWESDLTVESITDELGIGRGTVYGAVEPIDAGLACRRCGARMVFTNRTRRETGLAICPECGAETDVTTRRTGARGWLTDSMERVDWTGVRDGLRSVEPERAAVVGGAAALGVLIGAAAALTLRDRG